ncbi:hypothetical protein, partial [Salmonella sp. s55044]|uniref:hypothetical protein n=1 Tax=Salmonella sp. s55044 TaxID=3159677 RepID=UPI00398022CD
MSTVATCFSVTILVFMSLAIANEQYYATYTRFNRTQRVAIDSVLLALSCLEILFALQGAAYAKKTLLGGTTQTTVTNQQSIASVPVLTS